MAVLGTLTIVLCIYFLTLLQGDCVRFSGESGLVWLEYGNENRSSIRMFSGEPLSWNPTKPDSIAVSGVRSLFKHIVLHRRRGANATIFVSDEWYRTINAVTFDQYGLEYIRQLYSAVSRKVNGIAVDWVSDVVFWTDATYNAIYVGLMTLPVTVQILIDTDLKEPYGIVADPEMGYLFWTDVERACVERSSLGGRNRKLLFDRNVGIPTSLALDYDHDILYWIDSSAGDVISGDMMGNSKRRIKIGRHGIFGLAVFWGYIIMSHPVDRKLIMVHPEKSSPIDIDLQSTPYGLGVYYERHTTYNPCAYYTCPGICVSASENKHECVCHKRAYLKMDDEKSLSCLENVPDGSIILTKLHGVYQLPRNFPEFQGPHYATARKIADSSDSPGVLVSDVTTSSIYYYERKNMVIQKAPLGGKTKSYDIVLAVGSVQGLAVDWMSQNLYWTDDHYNHIMVSRSDGRFPVVLIRKQINPKAIAVHPIRRYLFWSNVSYSVDDREYNKLMRSFLDGSNQTTIASVFDPSTISSITIDFSQDRIYWCENSLNHQRSEIRSSDFSGNNGANHLLWNSHIFALSIMNDYLVFSDISYYNEGVYAVDKITGETIGAYRPTDNTYESVYDLTFHHISNQPVGNGPCSQNNGGCDQICLPNSFSFQCACTFGYFLRGGNKCETVALESWLLLVVDQRYRAIFQIDPSYIEYYAVPLQQLKQPHGITYDTITQMVYWSDVQLGTISGAFLNGSHQHVIFGSRRHLIPHIAMDSELRLLYYVDANKEVLGVIWLKNETYWVFRTLIRGHLIRPFGLSIDSARGYLYMTEGEYLPKILRAKMDGSNLTALVSWDNHGVYKPRGITINKKGTVVYWVDSIQNCIQERNLTSNTSRPVVVPNRYNTSLQWYVISDVAVSRKKLYWTDMETGNVFRATLPECQDVIILGHKDVLFRPAGIIAERETKLIDYEKGLRGGWFPAQWPATFDSSASSCSIDNGGCDNACLPTPEKPTCLDDFSFPTYGVHEYCTVPAVYNGLTLDNREGYKVSIGYELDVECLPVHSPSTRGPAVCTEKGWKNIPNCILDYKLCGSVNKGYTVFTKSGDFYVYPQMKFLRVLCIGGGGGGFDGNNEMFHKFGKAGDGGTTMIRDAKKAEPELYAHGGSGGTLLEGGTGGTGNEMSGGSGGHSQNCTGGGAAGETRKPEPFLQFSGSSDRPFCGGGGMPHSLCNISDGDVTAPRACPINGSAAGLFGGGAGSSNGGAGGGGGYSQHEFNPPVGGILQISVGEAGRPSYGRAGGGIVVIAWKMSLYEVANTRDDCELWTCQ